MGIPLPAVTLPGRLHAAAGLHIERLGRLGATEMEPAPPAGQMLVLVHRPLVLRNPACNLPSRIVHAATSTRLAVQRPPEPCGLGRPRDCMNCPCGSHAVTLTSSAAAHHRECTKSEH